MSSIDLAILGMVLEEPRSAYDIQKDVEYPHFSRWTKISVPSVYRKVLQLQQQGYLKSDRVQGDKGAGKAVYAITERGKAYFRELMGRYASQPVPLQFDLNVVVTNLNKLEKEESFQYLDQLWASIQRSAQTAEQQAAAFAQIPLVGRTVFGQQRLVYQALLEWLDGFAEQWKHGQ